jgi:hypothetical protein
VHLEAIRPYSSAKDSLAAMSQRYQANAAGVACLVSPAFPKNEVWLIASASTYLFSQDSSLKLLGCYSL